MTKIQFRLNPNHKEDKEPRAIKVRERLLREFSGDRELFTELLLACENNPLSSTVQVAQVSEALNMIYRKIDEHQAQMQHLIVEALQSLDLSQFVNRDGRSVADELGDKVPDRVYQAMLQNTHAQEFDVD